MEENEIVNETLEETSPALEGIQDLEEAPQEQAEEAPQQEEIKPKSDDNIRRLRQAKEKVERERDEALRYIEEVRRQQAQKPAEPEEDYSLELDPSDLAEGKHLLKMNRRIEKMERESLERSRRYEQQSQAAMAESQLRVKYPDIDKVINPDSIAALREEYPELAESINSNNNTYSKAVAAYTMIKRLGIHKDEVSTEGEALLRRNNSRPRASASIAPNASENALDHAHSYGALTKEMKAQALKELNDVLGN